MQAVMELCHNCEGCRASGESYPPLGAFFFLGGGDRGRKSDCLRNNQPDTLVPTCSIASLQWEMRGHAGSSLQHRKFFSWAVSLTEICLERSRSSAMSCWAGRFSYSAAMWCLWTPYPNPSMPSAVRTAFLLHKA